MLTATRHPYAHTLELLMIAVAKLPPGFPLERAESFRASFERFVKAGESAEYKDIHRTIVELGFESWPHRRAYEEMYGRYGRASEEAHLLERLDKGVREKYERFIHDGGKIGYVEQARTEAELRAPSLFERYFTPEEKFAISQALLTAREDAREEIVGLLAGPKVDEYEARIEHYRAEQKHMQVRVAALASMAEVSGHWREDILARVGAIEEGWSVLEKPYTLDDLDHEVEYWKGTLASFLHA